MQIKYLLLLLLLNCYVPQPIHAQAINTIPDYPKDKSYFLYEVKLIDEFIERFNDAPSSYIRQQCMSLYGTDTMITRTRLLKTLLDKKQNWKADTTLFINEITATQHPQYLNFTDSNWYAVANCIFLYRDQPVTVPIVLHIKTVNGASKWMIAGFGNSEVFRNTAPLPTSKNLLSSSGDFIPTSSYGTDFIVFNNIFTNKITPGDYIELPLLLTPRGRIIIQLLQENKLRFQQVKNINYHFFQLENRIFTVEQFKRKETNSGWLISTIQKVNRKEKEDRLQKLLYP
jgi:hypothetical protein